MLVFISAQSVPEEYTQLLLLQSLFRLISFLAISSVWQYVVHVSVAESTRVISPIAIPIKNMVAPMIPSNSFIRLGSKSHNKGGRTSKQGSKLVRPLLV